MTRSIDEENMRAAMESKDLEISDKRLRAHRLRLTGMSWAQIAEACEFRNERHAHQEVQIYYQQAAVLLSNQEKKVALEEALGTLDELQHAHWPAALAGDDKSANVVLKCVATKAKLQGLDTTIVENVAAKLVLIQGHEEQYKAQLMRIVEDQTKPKALGAGS